MIRQQRRRLQWHGFPCPLYLQTFFGWEAIFSLAAAVGKPLQVDMATTNKTKPSCTRVKVEVDCICFYSLVHVGAFSLSDKPQIFLYLQGLICFFSGRECQFQKTSNIPLSTGPVPPSAPPVPEEVEDIHYPVIDLSPLHLSNPPQMQCSLPFLTWCTWDC